MRYSIIVVYTYIMWNDCHSKLVSASVHLENLPVDSSVFQ